MDNRLTWPEYLSMITDGAPGARIAELTGLPESTISRWLSGKAEPRPRQVVTVARAYGTHPLQALIAAGYLDPSDAELAASMPRRLQLREFTELELAQEIVRRVEEGQAGVLNEPLDESHPAMQKGNVTRIRHTPTEGEAEELGAVAKPGDKVIEIDEFE